MRVFSQKNALFCAAALVFMLCMGLFAPYASAQSAATADMHILREDTVIATFRLEIAESHNEKLRGLMFRESLPVDHGMIFYYSPPVDAKMWMKNTLIPLDMLFVDAEQRIVHIHHNAIPHSLTSIGSGQLVAAVVEINGGEAAAQNIQLGDRIAIERHSTQGNTP